MSWPICLEMLLFCLVGPALVVEAQNGVDYFDLSSGPVAFAQTVYNPLLFFPDNFELEHCSVF
jgi:hypothetical protein